MIEVVEEGLLTTVQDIGRTGCLRFGVPESGAMDKFAFRAANILVGNTQDAACIEMVIIGPRLKFLENSTISLTGANLTPKINGSNITLWESIDVLSGSVLEFGNATSGARCYLAVKGGVDVPIVLGSRSTYLMGGFGGFAGRALNVGDNINILSDDTQPVRRKLPQEHVPVYKRNHIIRVIMGPQDEYFTEEGIRNFLDGEYRIGNQSDRMGYRLSGPNIEHKSSADIVSDAVPLGAIQVPGDGQPIILMTDRGPTGGYAKIAVVISADIYKLAQAFPGDVVSFQNVTLEDAYMASDKQETSLNMINISSISRFHIEVNGDVYEVDAELESDENDDRVRPPFVTSLTHLQNKYDIEVQSID